MNTQPQPSTPNTLQPPPIRGDQRVFFVGKTNSGKSYVARYLLKMMRQAGWRIVVIDPKKDWMGRGEEKREFSSGDKKERGTVDRPVSVSSFRPFFICTDISACFMGC